MLSLNPKDWLLLVLTVITLSVIGGAAYKEYQYNSLKAEYAEYVSKQSALMAEAERQAKEKLDEQVRAKAEIEATYRDRLDSNERSLVAALERVRKYKASAGVSQPAEAAPAECRAYEASPAQLSDKDREFLVRIGAEADGLAEQVNALQKYIREITK